VGDLSELEACVLGLVWSEGPCTPYRVQQMVGSSPSPHWSGSAGAIYPIFERLEKRGWVSSEARSRGRRPSRAYRVTPRGRGALRKWVGPPLPEWTADIPIDPLRTRLRFLGALPAEKRRALLREAKEQVEGKLKAIRADCRRLKKLSDPFPHAMARGAIHMMRARIRWLDEIERSLENPE